MEDKILKSSSLLTMPGFKWGPSWERATRKICFLDASQKFPRYLVSCSNPYGLPAENATFSRKVACSFPWFSASRFWYSWSISFCLPSVLLSSKLPAIARNYFTKFYTDWFLCFSFSLCCGVPAAVNCDEDFRPFNSSLDRESNCYFQCMSFRKKITWFSFVPFHGFVDSLRVFILDHLIAVLRLLSFRCDFGMNSGYSFTVLFCQCEPSSSSRFDDVRT